MTGIFPLKVCENEIEFFIQNKTQTEWGKLVARSRGYFQFSFLEEKVLLRVPVSKMENNPLLSLFYAISSPLGE